MYLRRLRKKQLRFAKKIGFWRFILDQVRRNNYIASSQDNFDFKSISLGNDNVILKNVSMISRGKGQIIIGENCKFESYAILESLNQGIVFGSNCSVNQYSILRAWGKIKIGNDVRIGPSVQIMAMNHNFQLEDVPIWKQGISGDGIVVGNNVWIGGNVVILDGVTIGNNCVIGASAVVTKSVEDNSVVVGNPARKIRNLYDKG